jgi:hypothetical protein
MINFENVKLDPTKFISGSSFNWSCFLLKSKIKLELISDVEIYNFLQRGIRGGISSINLRKATSNNPYLSTYDSNKETTYLMNFDQNNQYGFCMLKPIPYANFCWLSESEVKMLNVLNISDNSEIGYILEVSLIYPSKIHEKTNIYPLAPEKICIRRDQLSSYCENLAKEFNIKLDSNPKLIPNLYDKEHYVIHYRHLKQLLQLGIELKLIHRGIQFNQKPFMRKYVEELTEIRRLADNQFDSDSAKFKINSLYGCSLMNPRNRIDYRLITKQERLINLAAKPYFKSFKIFNPSLVGVEMNRIFVKLDRPIYIGFSILEYAKMEMNSFHYDFISRIYGDSIDLCATDTDSFVYYIKSSIDPYKVMYLNPSIFDTSNFPKNHYAYSALNAKRPGCFKSEFGIKPISSFVGLKPKLYSIKLEDTLSSEINKGKGIPKIRLNNISHKEYDQCLVNSVQFSHDFETLRSQKHKLYIFKSNKCTLSPYDNKRYILNCGIKTLAYGHYTIHNR